MLHRVQAVQERQGREESLLAAAALPHHRCLCELPSDDYPDVGLLPRQEEQYFHLLTLVQVPLAADFDKYLPLWLR